MDICLLVVMEKLNLRDMVQEDGFCLLLNPYVYQNSGVGGRGEGAIHHSKYILTNVENTDPETVQTQLGDVSDGILYVSGGWSNSMSASRDSSLDSLYSRSPGRAVRPISNQKGKHT